MCDAPALTTEAAFARYEAIRARLPAGRFPARSRRIDNLDVLADEHDAFVLDAFGVLNIGASPVPGAVARLARLRARGKRLCVLTNAASFPRAAALAKYRRLGFDFTAQEVVSSRDVATAHLDTVADGALWAAISATGDEFTDIDARVGDLIDTPALWTDADAFLFLSSARWNYRLQHRLIDALGTRPRPVVIANPDLVAPYEGGLSVEPGFWGHDIQDRTGITPVFFGKPYREAYDAVARRMDLARAAMVGDTLHTDVLGGAAAGLATVLISDHGLFAGQDVASYVSHCGLVPTAIAPTT